MAAKMKVSLPEFLDLGGNWSIEWDAVDPTTGDTVAGVVISNTSLLDAGGFDAGSHPPPVLVEAPLLAHVDQAT